MVIWTPQSSICVPPLPRPSSHDQPVIGQVAISIGALALARGDLERALRAVDLATVVIGAYDGSNPQVVAIEEAARTAGIGRASAGALTRPRALEELSDLIAQHP